jgi:WD40 repeat protein
LKTSINIERKCIESKYEFLIYPFHSNHINGIDVCLKKNLIVTCSHDNSIRIWNYITKTLEICEVYLDEPMSVAFHPSGFHIVVGFVDRVRMMNVFSRNIKSYKEIPIKGCREIKFSHGGAFFACANQYAINVYRFYTAECPPEYVFKEHQAKVKCIEWTDDDSGFVSAGMDCFVIFWKLNPEIFSSHGDKKSGQE